VVEFCDDIFDDSVGPGRLKEERPHLGMMLASCRSVDTFVKPPHRQPRMAIPNQSSTGDRDRGDMYAGGSVNGLLLLPYRSLRGGKLTSAAMVGRTFG
jgi:hypothetical protein